MSRPALLAINEWVLKPVMSAAHARRQRRRTRPSAPGMASRRVLYVLACLAVVLLVWKEDFG